MAFIPAAATTIAGMVNRKGSKDRFKQRWLIVSEHILKRRALVSAQKWRRKGFKTVRVRTLGKHKYEVRIRADITPGGSPIRGT